MYPAAASGLSRALGGRLWAENSSTPYYFYRDSSSVLHRVDYDDVESLTLKYKYARQAGARGIGMWTANSIDYTNKSQVSSFWEAMKVFTAEDDMKQAVVV